MFCAIFNFQTRSSTGDTWDMDGNYSGNMNDWLWD